MPKPPSNLNWLPWLLAPLRAVQTSHREPKPTSVRGAVSYIHEFTKLSISQLSNRLFISSNQFNRLSSTGIAPGVTLKRLITISEQYHLPQHAEFFRVQEFLLQESKRKRGVRHTNRD